MKDLSNFGLIRKHLSLSDYRRYDRQDRSVYVFSDENLDKVLEKLYNRLIDAMDKKKNLPILRIADGEYQFLLGKNEFNLRKPIFELIKNMLRQFQLLIMRKDFKAFSRTYSSGYYGLKDKEIGRDIYKKCLRNVSKEGIIAAYFIIKPNFYTEQYFHKFLNFLNLSGADLNENNYLPFYFVYILLTNRKYSSIYSERHIHLVTNFTENKRVNIENSLYSLGVKKISWSYISREKSLHDYLALTDEMYESDIIFVGAGIGKPNIFNQLKDVGRPVVDAGYIFEVWQDPKLALERDYCSTG